ncbi:MAG: cobyric acid synthase [Pseudomonadota bacterium]
MAARALMIQGTGSNVGKSVIVAGLCRLARRHGLRVAPFKPQNMSNNAAVTQEGGEIGRAQALQARAAGVVPSIHHNPVLIKPESDRGARLLLHGRPIGRLEARHYRDRRERLLGGVLHSFSHLVTNNDLILVEGAGSPAEVNLRDGDIANMGFASAAGVPVVLIGDIDRGGVIASIVGTKTVLAPNDASHVRAFIINRFRGDPDLFAEGIEVIHRQTGWPCLGVIPWLDVVGRLPAEDAVDLERPIAGNRQAVKEQVRAFVEPLQIAVPLISRIANFDDLDPLRAEPNVELRFVVPGTRLPATTDVVLLPGTKATLGDLNMLRDQGWAEQIVAHARRGGWVTGICGGMQMLGRSVADPQGLDGVPGATEGLGLLDFRTVMGPEKEVREASGRCLASDAPVRGYEIHSGKSEGAALTAHPMLRLERRFHGARSPDGRIEGCYLHGLFTNDAFRRAWLERRRPGAGSTLSFDAEVDAALDELADRLAEHLDIHQLFDIASAPSPSEPSASEPSPSPASSP